MGRSKRHHYVPQGLQRYFCNDDGKIWYAKRSSLAERFPRIEPRNTDSAFQQRNFYTVLSDLDNPSDEVERLFYGAVDDQVGKVIAEVVPIVDNGNAPLFKGQPLESFKNTVLALHRRSIDLTKDHDEQGIGHSIIESTIANASAKLGLNRDEALRELRFPEPQKLGRNIRVRAQTVRPDLALDALEPYQVATIVAGDRSSFVLGSRMIYRISNGTSDKLGSKNVELWFPITPKYCLVLHALGNGVTEPIVWPGIKVREINEYIVERCHDVGSHSDKLLRSLLGEQNP